MKRRYINIKNGSFVETVSGSKSGYLIKKDTLKGHILESMKILISEGESLASYDNGNFSEFATENDYPLDLVEEVYSENEDLLEKMWASK